MIDTCCTFTLRQTQQAVVETCIGRRLVTGPSYCSPYLCCFEHYRKVDMKQLDANQYIKVVNDLQPEMSRYVAGEKITLAKLENAWENLGLVQDCSTLDQDDYLIVCGKDGNKSIIPGPGIYTPRHYGETIVLQANAVMCPVNHYMIINDADSKDKPVIHLRGPMKFIPHPFQTITMNGSLSFHPCIEVTAGKGVHLQRATGAIELLDTPQFYMPEVGEKVLKVVNRIVMLTTNFCIVKSPTGAIYVKHGVDPAHRAFFLGPFEEFVTFTTDAGKETVLSTLPTFLKHQVKIRTNDNVVMFLLLRIQYRICDVPLFSSNPIEFCSYIKMHVQNCLLDRFAQVTLRDFMASFSSIAEGEVAGTREFFNRFGVDVEAIQILNYECPNTRTEQLLKEDINTNVVKQNELRARQMDVVIQEQINEVERRQKDLEIQLILKDNEIELERKKLENQLRLKELDIEIQEEHKRTELLELKRGNDLVEAEFEGRAKGHEFREFINGIDANLSHAEKLSVFFRKCELARADVLYAKVNTMAMYPANIYVETHQIGDGTTMSFDASGELQVNQPDESGTHAPTRSKGGWKNSASAKKDYSSSASAEIARKKSEEAKRIMQDAQDKLEKDRLEYQETLRKNEEAMRKADEELNRVRVNCDADGQEMQLYTTSIPGYGASFSVTCDSCKETVRTKGNNSSPVWHCRCGADYCDSCSKLSSSERAQKTVEALAKSQRNFGAPNVDNLKKKADGLNSARKYQDAILAYNDALAACPENDDAMRLKLLGNLSIAYKANGNDMQCLSICETALKIDPKNVKCLVRAMQAAKLVNINFKTKLFASRIMQLGSQVVGAANYAEAKGNIK